MFALRWLAWVADLEYFIKVYRRKLIILTFEVASTIRNNGLKSKEANLMISRTVKSRTFNNYKYASSSTL